MINNHNIILYDGLCFYCNSFILQILKNDNGYFKVVDQNSVNFNDYIIKYSLENNSETIYFIDSYGSIYEKSDAIIKILNNCNYKYKSIGFFLALIPKTIRDFFYVKFSKNRHNYFKTNNCVIPSKEIINRTLN